MDALVENVMMFVSAAEILAQMPGRFLAVEEKEHAEFSKGLMECSTVMLMALADERRIDRDANLGDLGLSRTHEAMSHETVSRLLFAPVYYSTILAVTQYGVSPNSQAVFSGVFNRVTQLYEQYTWIEDADDLAENTSEAYPDLAKLVSNARSSSSINNGFHSGSALKSSSSINNGVSSNRKAGKKASVKKSPDAREQAYLDAVGEMKTTAETADDFERLAQIFKGYGDYKNSELWMNECLSNARNIRRQQKQYVRYAPTAPEANDAREKDYANTVLEMKTTASTADDFERLAQIFKGYGDYKNSELWMEECYSKARQSCEQQAQPVRNEPKEPLSWRDVAEKISIAIAIIMLFSIWLIPHVMRIVS